MNMTVLAITLIFVGLMEIFGFAAALLLLRKKLEDFRQAEEQFSDNFLRNYALARSDEWALLGDMAKQVDILNEQYEAIDAAYDTMNVRYLTITDNYKKLLDAWEKVEERYSDCYDQLKYQNERFDRIEKFFVEPQLSNAILKKYLNETNACKWEADDGECTNVVSGAFGQICVANDPADCPYSGMELGDVEQ